MEKTKLESTFEVVIKNDDELKQLFAELHDIIAKIENHPTIIAITQRKQKD